MRRDTSLHGGQTRPYGNATSTASPTYPGEPARPASRVVPSSEQHGRSGGLRFPHLAYVLALTAPAEPFAGAFEMAAAAPRDAVDLAGIAG